MEWMGIFHFLDLFPDLDRLFPDWELTEKDSFFLPYGDLMEEAEEEEGEWEEDKKEGAQPFLMQYFDQSTSFYQEWPIENSYTLPEKEELFGWKEKKEEAGYNGKEEKQERPFSENRLWSKKAGWGPFLNGQEEKKEEIEGSLQNMIETRIMETVLNRIETLLTEKEKEISKDTRGERQIKEASNWIQNETDKKELKKMMEEILDHEIAVSADGLYPLKNISLE